MCCQHDSARSSSRRRLPRSLATGGGRKRCRITSRATPRWLHIQAPAHLETIPDLHSGECAAISLARELDADLLLIDEMDGRSAALARNLRVAGTIGILERAAEAGILDLAAAFARIKQTDSWVSPDLLDMALESFRLRKR